MVVRRVMGLVDNGRYFMQCANKECKFRVWLVPMLKGQPDVLCPKERTQSARWSRHMQDENADVTQQGQLGRSAGPGPGRSAAQCKPESGKPTGLFVRRAATGEFVHGRHGMAQMSGHLLGVPQMPGMLQKPATSDEHS